MYISNINIEDLRANDSEYEQFRKIIIDYL